MQSTPGMYTIVGVVENAQYWPPNDPQEMGHPMYFLPAWQWPQLPASTAEGLAVYGVPHRHALYEFAGN